MGEDSSWQSKDYLVFPVQAWWPGGATYRGDTLKRKAALQPAAWQAEVKRVLGRHHSHLLSVPALQGESFRKTAEMSEGTNDAQVAMNDVVQVAVNDDVQIAVKA